ncbi:MAG: DNA polymerase III subunit alpha [Candidatus Saccharicenans sp.]|nr:DNA polymerase III subunit alpha [Candidatus Saccharicenans sp.]
MDNAFIHLHVHSEYSILDGCLRISDLVDTASRFNMPAIALTDHGNIFGAVEFFKTAKKQGIKPIIGCEVYLAPRSRFDKKPGNGDETSNYHLVLLVKDEKGYRNLCRLLSAAYIEGFYYRPRIDKEILRECSAGLIALSSCLKGEVNDYLLKEMEDRAEQAVREYLEIFGPENFYLELQDHGLPEQKKIIPGIVDLSRRLGIPLVATNDVHFLKQEDAQIQDVLLCIQTNKKLSDPDRIRFSGDQFYLKSTAEMRELFKDYPEAIENTRHIAARCNFEFPLGNHFLPKFQPPGGQNLRDYFEQVVHQGFEKRLQEIQDKINRGLIRHTLDDYHRRLEKEIKLIEQMGFEGYFLIVWDLIRAARERGIPVGPGRGSAAGSLIAYCLGITQIDPIEYDLLFERFLNPERISLPDIDIDFCGRRRQEVIDYVTEKYGRDSVCQIITFGTMAARQAIRDVGRVMDLPNNEVDRVAKLIPSQGPDATIEGALKNVPELKELYQKNEKIATMIDIARKLQGQVRHPSIHAAGIVIAPKPLVEFLPLFVSNRGEITTQFAMEDIESLGLLKMDLLGLRNLTVITDALQLIEKDTGIRVDLDRIPLDDPATFEVFQQGRTNGVFQFESYGMKNLLRNFKPEEFRDLIAMNALFRPGPLNSGMTDEFVQRKHHPERIQYGLPQLEPILKETRGIIVYQEQVMRIATDLAGFTMAEADMLRKAMGKKIKEMMKAQREKFVQGCRKNGIPAAKAEKIFDQIAQFAEYGFNKSHSAAYAYLAFQTAYLKAHYPLHYLAALLTSEAEKGDTSQIVKYLNECRELGIQILPPDINRSHHHFTVEGDKIRIGLAAIKNVGENTINDLIALREKRGGFKDLFDLFEEYDSRILNRKALESLIKAGALDSFGWKRSRLYYMVDLLIEYGHQRQKAREERAFSLFGDEYINRPEIPQEVLQMNEWDEEVLLAHEKEVLGTYITSHPLARYRKRIENLVSHTVDSLDPEEDFDREVRLCGIIISVKLLKTKKEERMATFVLEDLTGQVDVTIFPDAYNKFNPWLKEGQLIWLKGRMSSDSFETRKIIVSQIMPLEEALEKLARKVVLKVPLEALDEESINRLRTVLEEFAGECPLYLQLENHSAFCLMQSAEVSGIRPTDEFIEKMEELLGQNAVVVEY